MITSVALTEEEPQIICSVCGTVDCMIHNPRHRYCMYCGQRLIGPHVCPNTENVGPDMTPVNEIGDRVTDPSGIPQPLSTESDVGLLQEMLMNRYQLRDQCSPRMPTTSLSVPVDVPSHLPTYREAIASNQEMLIRDRIPPEVQNVLHHIEYSSDPEEARIHFELTSPSRSTRVRDQ